MGFLTKLIPVLGKIFSVVPLAIQVAEIVAGLLRPGEKTGAIKLEAVKKIVRAAIQGSEIFAGKDLVDEDLFDQGITKIANGAVDIMNALKVRG